MQKSIYSIVIILLSSILFSNDLLANLGKISGKLIDKENGKAIKGSRVSAIRLKDSTIAGGALSDNSGSFEIANLQKGTYFVKATYTGYRDYKSENLSINEKQSIIDIGAVNLALSSYNVGEVNVSADREAIQTGIDKKIITVDKLGASIGGTAIDILQNVPSVTVDVDGNVALRGSQNVQILIDGRPSGLSGSQILEQIPASSIETVELITNPSSKFEASGQSGIINIVMKKKIDNGLNGLITLNAGTIDRYNATLNLNYRMSGINLYTNIDSRFFNMLGTASLNQNSILSTKPDSINIGYLNRYEDFRRKGNFNNVKFGVDFDLPDNYTASFSALYNFGNRMGSEIFTFHSGTTNNIMQNKFYRDVYGNNPMATYDLAASFRKTFDSKKHFLTLDFLYSNSSRDGSQQMLQKYSPDIDPYLLQRDSNLSNNNVLNIQLDYVKPFEGESKFETGMRASIRKVGMNYKFLNFDSSVNDYILNSNISNEFIYDENIVAAYLSFTDKIKDFAYQAGLRAEYTKVDGNQKTINKTFSKDYINLFPSAFITYNLSELNQIQLSYTRRINRPSFRQLNIFVDYEDPLNLEAGNPDLNPEFVNSLELTHDIKFSSTNLISSIFYRITDDVISEIRTMTDSNTTFTTSRNLLTSKNIGAEFIIQQTLADFWKIDGNFSYYFASYESDPKYFINIGDNYSWNVRLNNNIKLFDDVDLQVTGNYNAPEIEPQGKTSEVYWADLSLKINILDGNGTINFRVSDIFDTQKWGAITNGSNFTSEFTHKRLTQAVFLGFTYKINDYKRQVQKPRGDGRDSDSDM
jgi:outer membrane receptor protein involved in Fe transport